jgi:hypothetical protein
MTACYHTSIYASGFYRSYKNPGWVLVATSWYFIIMDETLSLFQLLSLFAFESFGDLSFFGFLTASRRSWLVAVLLAKPLPV